MKGFCKVNFFKQDQIRFVEIFVTLACNARCDFCSNGLYSFKSSSLELADYLKIIDECAELNVPIIALIGGEPLLYKDLEALISRIHSHGIIPAIATNGYLLTKDKMKILAACGLKMVVCSIHSTIPSVHDQTYKLKDSFRHLFEVKEYCDAYGIQFGLATVIKHSDFPNDNFRQLVELAVSSKISLSINPLIPTGYALDKQDELLNENEFAQINELSRYNPYISTHLTNNYFGFGCPAGNSYLTVLPSGEIMPCFFFPVSLGNVKEMTLRQAWEKARQSPLFQKKYPTCFAGLDKEFISEYLRPIFSSDCIPLPLEKHPLYDEKIQGLKDLG
jgi:MoaA/NifB/PqqE/SkfB family radical SAM enzyme